MKPEISSVVAFVLGIGMVASVAGNVYQTSELDKQEAIIEVLINRPSPEAQIVEVPSLDCKATMGDVARVKNELLLLNLRHADILSMLLECQKR